MKLKIKKLDLDAGGKTIVILNKDDADDLGVHPLDRVVIRNGRKCITAVVNISENFVKEGTVLAYDEVAEELGLKNEKHVEITRREELLSKKSIRRKLGGARLSEREVREIVNDVVQRNLNDLELAALITSLHVNGISVEEIIYFIKSMVETGKNLDLGKKKIVDKHSLGGCPGDKTTILVVPIIAAAGLTIPKTSSRSITSPAGTADRFEILADVELGINEMKRVVRKTNGCIVWGGSLDIAPADDLFIRAEYPLCLDPLYIPSIMSKKKSVNATHLVIDIPTGRGTKVKTFGEAYEIASNFIEIGRRIGIMTSCGVTFGEQPIGRCIGPALEAREALEKITKPDFSDVTEKACSIAGILLQMAGKGNKKTAFEILNSGKAEKKLREIIREQSGNPRVKPDDIAVGEKKSVICSQKSGTVMWVRNGEIAQIAKLAGSPKDKGAGIELHAKIGDIVRKGDPLFTIYSMKLFKMKEAEKAAMEYMPVVVVDDLRKNMLIKKVEHEKFEKHFCIER